MASIKFGCSPTLQREAVYLQQLEKCVFREIHQLSRIHFGGAEERRPGQEYRELSPELLGQRFFRVPCSHPEDYGNSGPRGTCQESRQEEKEGGHRMIAISCALAVAAGIGLAFPQTRAIGILCLAVLCLLYPIPVTLALVVVGGMYWKWLA